MGTDRRGRLAATDPPSLGERLARFVSYFTILSNVLVLVTAASLARDPRRDGRVWRVLRLNAVVGISVTALVHVVALRPLTELLPSLAFPLGWVAWTLLRGAVSGWYPYHFVDVDALGYAAVALNSVGVALLLLALSLVALVTDRRLVSRRPPQSSPPS